MPLAVVSWVALGVSTLALLVSFCAAYFPYARRPKLTLKADDGTHSYVEGDGKPYLRVLAHNEKGKRSAKRARLVLDGYKAQDDDGPYKRLGSPFLGWPSVFGQDSDSYVEVVFADAERPVSIGHFAAIEIDKQRNRPNRVRVGNEWLVEEFNRLEGGRTWYMHLDMASSFFITEDRDWLAPGEWTIRVILGADDGDARAYKVNLAWKGIEPTANVLLLAVLDSLEVTPDD